MRKVKFMLLTILLIAIVAGALALKVKTPNVCAYSTHKASPPCPATSICLRTHASTTVVTRTTANAGACDYATVLPSATQGPPCPDNTAQCPQSKTLVND